MSARSGGLSVILGGGGRHGRSATEWLFPAAVGLIVVLVLAMIAANIGSEKRAIRALPDGQRLAIYSQTMQTLGEFCGNQRPDALKEHCRDLASFVVQFEECRDECVTRARRQLVAAPTR